MHIQNILITAFKVASIIAVGTANVLLHCQSGTTATPIISSLS